MFTVPCVLQPATHVRYDHQQSSLLMNAQRLFAGISSLFIAAPLFLQPIAAVAQESSAVANRRSVQVVPQQNMDVRNDFQVGPTRFELTLAPGEEKTIEIELTSRMGRQTSFTLEKEDFSPSENENEQTRLYGENRGPYSAKDWITPLISSITLQQADRAYIPVTVSVPANADPGDHYAAVLAKRDVSPSETNGGIAVISRVGVLFLITVEGPVERKGTLLSFTTPKDFFTEAEVPLTLRTKNDGTVRMYPEGQINIRNILGVTVDRLPVKDWIVLRNSSRSSTLTWKPTFALGWYTAETELKVFGEAMQPLSVSFWVVPILPVLLILIAVFLVSFLVQYFFAHFEIKKK